MGSSAVASGGFARSLNPYLLPNVWPTKDGRSRRGKLFSVTITSFPGGYSHETTRDLCRRLAFSTARRDRKSTRLNSSHVEISYAVFCLKKKKKIQHV